MTIDQEGIAAGCAGGKEEHVRCIAENMAYCTDEDLARHRFQQRDSSYGDEPRIIISRHGTSVYALLCNIQYINGTNLHLTIYFNCTAV